MTIQFTPATLYQGKSEWFIQYRFRNPVSGKNQRFKERFDINRIHNKTDRLAYAQMAVKWVNQKLKEGYNPFTTVRTTTENPRGRCVAQLKLLVDQLCQDAPKSAPKTYRQVQNRFIRFLEQHKLDAMPLALVDDRVTSEFQGYMKAEKLSGKTINVCISHLGLIWDAAIKRKLTSANPFRGLKPVKKVVEEDIFEPLTTDELTTIFSYLNANGHRGFVRFLGLIYYAFARPVEITRLRVKDIDLHSNTIRFRATETKNGKAAFVQIVPPLKEMLQEMELLNKNPEHYLFSGLQFMPGTVQKDSNHLGEKWRILVQDENGLNIKKKMYALKHTGNIHYLLNNKGKVDLKWQQMQNRHTSAAMTERYNRSLGAYFIDVKELVFNSIL